jgi:hypothetical protein
MILGNHELLNIIGDFQWTHPDSMSKSGGILGRGNLLSPSHSIGRYLRSRPVVAKFHDYVFVHGGLSPKLLEVLQSWSDAETMNTACEQWLERDAKTSKSPFFLQLGPSYPLTYRQYENQNDCTLIMERMRRILPSWKGTVVAHVPHDPRSFREWNICNNTVLSIDFGMSRWKMGTLGSFAYLDLRDQRDPVLFVTLPGGHPLHSSNLWIACLVVLSIFAIFIWSRGGLASLWMPHKASSKETNPSSYGTW